MTLCATCSKNGATACCGRCKYVFYCDTKCQRRDWKKHKKECKIWGQVSNQKAETKKTKQSFMTHKQLSFVLDGYFRDSCASSIFSSSIMRDSLAKTVEEIIIMYLSKGHRSNGDCKAVKIEILNLFACLIGDNLLDFEIAGFGKVFEQAALEIMDGLTVKAFKSKYFNSFYNEYSKSSIHLQNDELRKLNDWKTFLNEAMYGDVLICTSARNNQGYNDYDFVIGLNGSCDLSFYRFSVDNGIGYVAHKKDKEILISTAMKNALPHGYYLNYYQQVYALYPMFTDYIQNRTGAWVEIGFIDQILQRYLNLGGKATLIIMKYVGFPPNDYKTKLFFNPVNAERERMARELFERMNVK